LPGTTGLCPKSRFVSPTVEYEANEPGLKSPCF
jgi:hypothetical protein